VKIAKTKRKDESDGHFLAWVAWKDTQRLMETAFLDWFDCFGKLNETAPFKTNR
jgi:hypothetical protein